MSAVPAPLTATMQGALAQAMAYGGALYRHPGGFWTAYENYDVYSKAFGTPTVQALVTRGAMTYDKWQEGRNGKFPIKALATPPIKGAIEQEGGEA